MILISNSNNEIQEFEDIYKNILFTPAIHG
jgi:hypothetical protein